MSIFIAFIIALLVTAIFMVGYRRGNNSIGALILFFIILFMAGIATQYWITPFGPVLWGIAWMPILFTVLIFTLLLSSPPLYYRSTSKDDAREVGSTVIGIFIWLLVGY